MRPKRGPGSARAALRRAEQAWRESTADPGPIEAELLIGGRHASAVLLRMEARPAVVAKLRPRGALDLERAIHEVILPELRVETPEFLGFASGDDEEDDVLFLEYVGGEEFQPSDPAHQHAAGRWLGRCHAASLRAAIPALVPRRCADEDRESVSETRTGLAQKLSNPALGDDGRFRVGRVGDLLGAACDRWPEWEEHTARVPMVLTHCAFITRNVRMRGSGTSPTAIPFDWDHVAVGSPALDMARTPGGRPGFAANASLESYGSALAQNGLSLEPSVIDTLARMGTVVRASACIRWLFSALSTEYAASALVAIDIYRRALDEALGD